MIVVNELGGYENANDSARRHCCCTDSHVDRRMSDFLNLFTIFCASDVFSWLLEYLTPLLAIYSVFTLIGGIFHGKSL